MFRILAIGDICGPRSVEYLKNKLWALRREHKISMVVANAENCAEPNGIDKQGAATLFESGVDVITTGNHVFRKPSVFPYLDDENALLRPLNLPSACPGHGDCIVKIDGYRVLCMNVLGSAFMDSSACPFDAVERCLERNKGTYDFALLDVHAEATGEKKAIAYNFAKELCVCFGTHTHVQTNDACILDAHCAYVTDVGMVGALDSILGVKKESVIHKLKTKMLSKFDFADGEIEANAAIFDIDESIGKAVGCKVIKF